MQGLAVDAAEAHDGRAALAHGAARAAKERPGEGAAGFGHEAGGPRDADDAKMLKWRALILRKEVAMPCFHSCSFIACLYIQKKIVRTEINLVHAALCISFN